MRYLFLSTISLCAVSVVCAEDDLPNVLEHELAGKLALIPAGEFMMGSPETDRNASSSEFPRHRVQIDLPFYMGVHEVTYGQFRKFVADSEYVTDAEKVGGRGWGYDSENRWFAKPPEKYSWRNTGYKQQSNSPIVNVSWKDARAYCAWLTAAEKEFRFRLPTEAEWEYGCRAGTNTKWSVGDAPQELCDTENIADDSLKSVVASSRPEYGRAEEWNDGHAFSAPVGSYKPNEFRLFDMHGNVSEWCNDIFDVDRYLKPDVTAVIGRTRVWRGGNYLYEASRARSSQRFNWPATEMSCILGFRVVRETVPKAESLEQRLALVPLYRFHHEDLQQHYYAYGAQEVEKLRKRQDISRETLLGYVSVKEEPRTVRLWRYEMPNRKQYFLHFVKGPSDPQIGSGLRAWLDRGGQPVPHYSVWVWQRRNDKRLVPIYATSMPDGTEMLFSRDRQEIKDAMRDTWNSRGIKRSDFGIAFYVYPEALTE